MFQFVAFLFFSCQAFAAQNDNDSNCTRKVSEIHRVPYDHTDDIDTGRFQKRVEETRIDDPGLYASVEYLPNLIEFGNKGHNQFKNYVFNSDKPTIVVLYSNTCGRSEALAEKLTSTLKDLPQSDNFFKKVNLATVNCLDEGEEICQFYYFVEDSYIQWPQIKVFDRNLKISTENLENIKSQDIYDFTDYSLRVDRDYLVQNVLMDAIGYDIDEVVVNEPVNNPNPNIIQIPDTIHQGPCPKSCNIFQKCDNKSVFEKQLKTYQCRLSKTSVIIASSITGVIILIAIAIGCYFLMKKREQYHQGDRYGADDEDADNDYETLRKMGR